MTRPLIIETGQVFGKLVVIKELPKYITPSGQKLRQFLCECSCVNKVQCKVMLTNLSKGHTISCGCHRIENTSKMRTTHGMSGKGKSIKHPLYSVWAGIIKRCADFENKYYGKKGIKVCNKWLGKNGFNNFLKWNDSLLKENKWKEGLEIDRQDNNKGYNPKNCRWVTRITNINNRSTTIKVEYKGIIQPLADLLRSKGHKKVSYNLAYTRINNGINVEEAICKPPNKHKTFHFSPTRNGFRRNAANR